VLKVSRSGYYDWLGRLDSPRVQDNRAREVDLLTPLDPAT
jgi:hypothetical protein